MKQLFEDLEKELALLVDYNETVSKNHWQGYKLARIETLISEIKKRIETK